MLGDAEADGVQDGGGDGETGGVGGRGGFAGQLGAVRVAVQQGEDATRIAPAATGSCAAASTSRPSTTTDARMPASTIGTATPEMPSTPPSTITPTNATGQTHSARPPLRPAHRPTATIASMWSRPVKGCLKPEANENGVLQRPCGRGPR